MRRDIGREILEGIRAIKRGEGRRVQVALPDVRAIREGMGLGQTAFAGLLGVSPRTVQDWEQGRRRPSGPALSLLKVAAIHPEAIREAIAA
jgi:putative transcriptional regulator